MPLPSAHTIALAPNIAQKKYNCGSVIGEAGSFENTQTPAAASKTATDVKIHPRKIPSRAAI
jgi:hypothetical protein